MLSVWGGLGTGSVGRHRNVLQPKAEIPAVAAQGPVASRCVYLHGCRRDVTNGALSPETCPKPKGIEEAIKTNSSAPCACWRHLVCSAGHLPKMGSGASPCKADLTTAVGPHGGQRMRETNGEGRLFSPEGEFTYTDHFCRLHHFLLSQETRRKIFFFKIMNLFTVFKKLNMALCSYRSFLSLDQVTFVLVLS